MTIRNDHYLEYALLANIVYKSIDKAQALKDVKK